MNLIERLLSAGVPASRWDEQEHSQPLLDCKGAGREAQALSGREPSRPAFPDHPRGKWMGAMGCILRRSDFRRFPRLAGPCPPEVPRGGACMRAHVCVSMRVCPVCFSPCAAPSPHLSSKLTVLISQRREEHTSGRRSRQFNLSTCQKQKLQAGTLSSWAI